MCAGPSGVSEVPSAILWGPPVPHHCQAEASYSIGFCRCFLSPHPAQRVSRLPLHPAGCLSPPLCSPLLLGRALVGRQPVGGPLRTRAGEQLRGAGTCHLAAPWVCCLDAGQFPEWQGHWTLTSRERARQPLERATPGIRRRPILSGLRTAAREHAGSGTRRLQQVPRGRRRPPRGHSSAWAAGRPGVGL